MNSYFSFIKYFKQGNLHDRINYLRWFQFIEKSQWWSKDELLNYQWQKIKTLLNHAYNYVPYYNELFRNIGAAPDDIKTLEDYGKIPFLTKAIVKKRMNDLISTHLRNKSKLSYFTTGGSTGQPLGFYRLKANEGYDRAFMNQQWKRVGYIENSRRVILRGELVKNNQVYQKFRFSNDWLLSSYHLSEDTISQYIDILNKIKPEFFHVYPSSMYIFTQLFIHSKLVLNFQPKAILCGSEPIFGYQRELMEKTFNSRVYSWLGQAEGAVMAGECEYSSDYHSWPMYSYIEFINDKDKILNTFGSSGEIVGTTINNYTFPFIRYKTGDLATYKLDHCEKCGRQFTILNNLQGRIQDVVILADGTAFPIGPAIFGIHDDKWTMINAIQIVQEKKGEILIRIDTLSDELLVLNFLKEIMERRIGHVLKYEFIFTKGIEKTKQGKHRFLIQKTSS